MCNCLAVTSGLLECPLSKRVTSELAGLCGPFQLQVAAGRDLGRGVQ